ncbi:MAG: hypothetical protein KC729_15720, partial [Candidatus Eisenbacteria bacterium]|nr:hypothetical protein [Candidatus Eisenbacteria bacterium]
ILLQHSKDAPIPPSSRTELSIPGSLEQLILRCLAKDPADRPASALEVIECLEQVERECGRWTNEDAEHWWRSYLPELSRGTTGPSEHTDLVGA